MIQPLTFRFIVRSPLGAYKKTVTRDASYVLGAGFRMSLTPEGICEEMTLTARNGVHPLDGSPGLGLQFADIVTVQMTPVASPNEADWISLYYGQLRQGGNPHDYSGENMVFRSLAVKLRATPTLDKGYAQMDGGALVRQLVQDTLASGALGTTGVIGTLSVGTGPQPPSTISCISYDPAAIPDLGVPITLTATNQQPLGVLLDTFVEAAKAKGIEIRWGVRADGVLTFRPVSTVEIGWPAEAVEWKEPVAEVMYTGVLWSVEKKPDGTWFRYLSRATEAASYGVEVKQLAVATGVRAWRPLVIVPEVIGTLVVTPGGADATAILQDGDLTSRFDVTSSDSIPEVRLTIPAGGAERLFVDAQTTGIPAAIHILYPDGSIFAMRASDPTNFGFTAVRYFADYFYYGLPEGAVVRLFAPESTPGQGATLRVNELRVEVLDRELLDGLARFHYQLPASAPGDLYRTGVLLPAEYGGKIRSPRPNGEADYTANVSLFEYSVWDAGGVRTAAKTGEPDDPAAAAQASLIKKGDVLATNNALNVP